MLVLLVAIGCGGSDGPGEEGTKVTNKKKTKKKSKTKGKKKGEDKGKDKAGNEEKGKGEEKGKDDEKPPDEAPAPPPAKDPKANAWVYPAGSRLAFQICTSFRVEKNGKVRRACEVDGWSFLRCIAAVDGAMPVVRENPAPKSEVVDGVTLPPRWSKDVSLIVYDRFGRILREGGSRERTLLGGMAEPVFPENGPDEDGSWRLERDFVDGRFLFVYRLAGTVDKDGRTLARIELSVTLPGGDPCGSLRLHKAQATLLFDPAQGMLVSAKGEFLYSMKEEGVEVAFRGSFERICHGATEMAPKEARETERLHTTYFRIVDLIAKKSLAAAEKMIDAFIEETDVAAHVELAEALREHIPDLRTFQPKGLLDRVRFPFATLPWARKKAPPIVMQGFGTVSEGRPRPLACVGSPCPAFWWKRLYKGGDLKAWQEKRKDKVLLLHIWMSWLPPSREALKQCREMAGRLDNAVLLDISMDTEQKSLNLFVKTQKLDQPLVWDRDNRAVEAFGLAGAPAFVVVDPAGAIRFGEVGYFSTTLDRMEEAARKAQK